MQSLLDSQIKSNALLAFSGKANRRFFKTKLGLNFFGEVSCTEPSLNFFLNRSFLYSTPTLILELYL